MTTEDFQRGSATPTISDEDLMRHIQANDDRAFEQLYDRHRARAYGLAHFICRNARSAEEAVQEGFIAVWRARATYDPDRGPVRAWLLTVIRRRSIDLMRRSGRHAALGSEAQLDCFEAPDSVVDEAERHDEGSRVRTCLQHLPPPQREVIVLAYFGGLTHTEIARRLELPVGTVKGRMRLGLSKMRITLTATEPLEPLAAPLLMGSETSDLR